MGEEGPFWFIIVFHCFTNSVFFLFDSFDRYAAFCCSFAFDLAEPVPCFFLVYLLFGFVCFKEFIFLLRRHLWSHLYDMILFLYLIFCVVDSFCLPLLPPYGCSKRYFRSSLFLPC